MPSRKYDSLVDKVKYGFIDPDPAVISQDWHLWTFGNCPLKDLQWDPGSLFWQCPYSQQQKKLEFFQYSAKLGRQILQATSSKEPTTIKYWTLEGISDERLKKTWRKLWDRGIQRKISAFQWLIIHKATPVGVWLGKGRFPTTCPCCRLYEESQRHCLWDCRWAQEIWKRILRVFSPSATNLTFTWGAVVWSSLEQETMSYESPIGSLAIAFASVHPFSILYVNSAHLATTQEEEQWRIINSIIAWFIWKRRCRYAFEELKTPPTETLMDLWVELLHSLKGQFEEIKGELDYSMKRREAFFKCWDNFHLYSRNGRVIRWKSPRWLFAPSIM